MLIDRKAAVNALTSKAQTTPLHESARLSTVGVAKLLLKAGKKSMQEIMTVSLLSVWH